MKYKVCIIGRTLRLLLSGWLHLSFSLRYLYQIGLRRLCPSSAWIHVKTGEENLAEIISKGCTPNDSCSPRYGGTSRDGAAFDCTALEIPERRKTAVAIPSTHHHRLRMRDMDIK